MLNKNKRYYILVFLSTKSKKIFFYVRRCINKKPINVGPASYFLFNTKRSLS